MIVQQPGTGRKTLPSARDTPITIPNHVHLMPIEMTGFMTLIPHDVLTAIEHTNCLMIVQCLERLEIFTGIETKNRYVIHDMYLRPLLYCNERSGFMSRQIMGSGRDFIMDMKDAHGLSFMMAHRTGECCTDQLTTNFLGAQLGTMSKEGCDNKFMINATGCNQPLVVGTPSCMDFNCSPNKRFPVMTSYGGRIGEIVKIYSGFLQEAFTDADSFLVHFPANMPLVLKLLMISATFHIDFTYFEQ